MRLAAPVAHPENPSQDLLRAGFTLQNSIIERLRQMGVGYVYVEYPALEALDRHLAVYLSPARQQILRQIHSSMQAVQKQARAAIPYEDYCTTTREMIDTLMLQGQNAIYLDQMSRQGGDAVAHAAAVAHLALLLGLKLEPYIVGQRSRLPANRAKDLVSLGVAGMLHDLGLTKLPEHLRQWTEADRPTDEAAFREWQTHAELGYDLVRHDVEPTAAAAVYQHHQHFDGSGFPRLRCADDSKGTLDGQRIHVFARIILAANLYDRLAAPGGKRPRRPNHVVHDLIARDYAGWLDPEILRILQAVVPPFPPGMKLALSDGSRAIVVEVDPESPRRPLVRRLATDGWTLEEETIDLRTDGAPEIVLQAA